MHDEKKQQQLHLLKLTEEHKKQLNDIAIEHALEITELDKGQGLRLTELLDSSTKTRIRSQELLSERDEEIAELKKKLTIKE